jgi:hypothetical protein
MFLIFKLFPALLIAYAKAWDSTPGHAKNFGDSKQRRPYTKTLDKDAPWWLSRSYFSLSLTAYATSLLFPYMLLVVWGVSIPPMLFTIPAVFGIIVYVAQKRRESEEVWGGQDKRHENGHEKHAHASGDEDDTV